MFTNTSSERSFLDVIEYYNRFLAEDNDEILLKNLIIKLTRFYACKLAGVVNEKDVFSSLELNPFEKEIMNFIDLDFIEEEDCRIWFNEYAELVKVENCNSNHTTSVLNSLAKISFNGLKNKVGAVIRPNILVSRIYKTIYLQLNTFYGNDIASKFYKMYEDIINYQDVIRNNSSVMEILNTSFERTRSRK